MIALLDYGSGNLRSVHHSLLKVGVRRCRALATKLGHCLTERELAPAPFCGMISL